VAASTVAAVKMCGGAEGPTFHLGQAEHRVLGGDDHIGIADQADPAADTEPVHGGDDGNFAFVDGFEGRETTPVGVDQRGEPRRSLHLLDVHAGVEPASLGAQDHHVGGAIAARGGDGVRQLEPPSGRDRVDRRVVDRHRHDAGFDGGRRDRHGTPGGRSKGT
jgi:hypothetical protein